ncbi:hypothetical protein EHQ68_05000 [Leptospira congkakensis]|uniref:Lipoprotein n=1 Tax=Leptospira congkakensis TaxID=2484932 RepID=A0A4Z1A7Y1_9LEPT|nr:hypothetical protein [Leptospira congkakensis]TGL90782.1 hypothetical protein EHQ69_12760 [Leptospira congkakensis]TGL91789.1 hypothetical protein EHQ68_05000 [Leptospira congkakensis]TGL98842.1 hypothetical protein EHQ70_04595 [Leptospira congkakensis]
MKRRYLISFFLMIICLFQCSGNTLDLNKKEKSNQDDTTLFLGAIGFAVSRGCLVNLPTGESYSAPNMTLTTEKLYLGFRTQPAISTITVSLKANQIVHITSTNTPLNATYFGYFKAPRCPIDSSLSKVYPINTVPFHIVENTANSIKVYSDVDGDYVLYIELDFYDKTITYKNDIYAKKE